MIFGFKQRGKDAVDAMNLFYYMTYESNIDLDRVEDPSLRASIEAQVVHFGKTPSQLFTKPHHPKENPKRINPGPLIISKDSELKTYFPQNRKPFLRPDGMLNYYDLSDKSIIKSKFFKDKEILALRLNGHLFKYN